MLYVAGAVIYAGCLWWKAVVDAVRHDDVMDILDCADAPGRAMAALRIGVHNLVLWPEAPGWGAGAGIAGTLGGCVLTRAPPALDMARRGAERGLEAWLSGPLG